MQGIGGAEPGTLAPVSRVAILYSNSLLMEGMEAYLRRAGRLAVSGLDLDEPGTWERLRSLQPDAVIVDSRDVRSASWQTLADFIRAHPRTRVIDVRTGSNSVDVYRIRTVPVAQPGDLLQALVGE